MIRSAILPAHLSSQRLAVPIRKETIRTPCTSEIAKRHVNLISHTAAEKPTAMMACPPCTKIAVASPASGPPLDPSRDFASVGGKKGNVGTRCIPQRSSQWPQLMWLAVQGAMLCLPEPKHLPHSLCLQCCAEEQVRAGYVDIHGL